MLLVISSHTLCCLCSRVVFVLVHWYFHLLSLTGFMRPCMCDCMYVCVCMYVFFWGIFSAPSFASTSLCGLEFAAGGLFVCFSLVLFLTLLHQTQQP